MVMHYNPKDELVKKVMVYESLIFLAPRAISIILSLVCVIIAIINVIFNSFIAYEQIMMFYRELRHKEESIRLERFLTLKDRPLIYMDESQIKVELTYPQEVTRKGKITTMVILLSINTILCMIPLHTTQIVVTLVGAFTSPLVIFVLPGYLFYDQLKKSDGSSFHRKLSLAMCITGVVLMLSMTTISFYVLRIDFFSNVDSPKNPTEL